jgi:hypothetical protein
MSFGVVYGKPTGMADPSLHGCRSYHLDVIIPSLITDETPVLLSFRLLGDKNDRDVLIDPAGHDLHQVRSPTPGHDVDGHLVITIMTNEAMEMKANRPKMAQAIPTGRWRRSRYTIFSCVITRYVIGLYGERYRRRSSSMNASESMYGPTDMKSSPSNKGPYTPDGYIIS